jgi:hypothetical protein
VPLSFLVSPWDGPCSETTARYDTVFIADFSAGGLALEAILARVAEEACPGRAVGLFHWPDYAATDTADLAPAVTEMMTGGDVALIRRGDPAQADRLVLGNPFVIRHPVAGLPEFSPARLDVFGGPELHAGEYRSPRPMHLPSRSEIETMFGAPPTWVSL